jgi:phospholipid/cholesterol/gamma-HCH transport system substrate-binding protein
MAESRADAILGAAVLAAAVGFVVYAGQVTGFGQSRAGYDLAASFNSAEGVLVGTDVRLGGVRVGTVSAMELNPQTFRADLRLTLQPGLALPEDTMAVVASEGLLGGAYIELRPGGSPHDLEPGGRIEETQSAVSLVTLLLRAVTGGGEEAAQ